MTESRGGYWLGGIPAGRQMPVGWRLHGLPIHDRAEAYVNAAAPGCIYGWNADVIIGRDTAKWRGITHIRGTSDTFEH
jgi:hypothetical protein